MIEQWTHGCLYAVTSDADPLAHPLEPYLALDTPDGWRFLFAPDYAPIGDGPHEITDAVMQFGIEHGFDLPRVDVISLWSDRDRAILEIARAYGLLPAEPGIYSDANAVLRDATPEGRVSSFLSHKTGWPNSTVHVHTTRNGVFKQATIILRTNNPYQARTMLILLGADISDVAALTDTP